MSGLTLLIALLAPFTRYGFPSGCPGREVRVRAWLSAIARLRESTGTSWGRIALARPSGNVLVSGGRGRGAHRGVRYVVHCFDSRGCLGRQDERRDHRRVFSHPSAFNNITNDTLSNSLHQRCCKMRFERWNQNPPTFPPYPLNACSHAQVSSFMKLI